MQPFAVIRQDHVKVIDRFGIIGFDRQRDDGKILQKLGVQSCVSAPGLVPVLQPHQLDAEHRGLDGIETAVIALDVVKIFLRLPVIPDHADLLRHLFVLGHDGAGLAEGAEVLAGVEAKAAGCAQGSCFFAFVRGAVGLAGVFDDNEVELASDFEDRVHVGRLAVKVDGDYGLRPWLVA